MKLYIYIILFNLFLSSSTENEKKNEESNNILLGFMLVLMCAVVATIGSSILYIDKILKYIFFLI